MKLAVVHLSDIHLKAASDGITELLEALRGRLAPSKQLLGVVVLPGNHDCDFKLDSDERRAALDSALTAGGRKPADHDAALCTARFAKQLSTRIAITLAWAAELADRLRQLVCAEQLGRVTTDVANQRYVKIISDLNRNALIEDHEDAFLFVRSFWSHSNVAEDHAMTASSPIDVR